MTNHNNEVIRNVFLEMTHMKEKMASMQEDITKLKEENKRLRYEYGLVNKTNVLLMDRVFPEWRNAGKVAVKKNKKTNPTLRLVS